MQIAFTILPEDIIRFNRYCANTIPDLRRQRWQSILVLIAIAITAFGIFYVALPHSIVGMIPLSIAILTLCFVVYNIFFLDDIIKKRVEQRIAAGGYATVLGHQQISLDSDGYRVLSDGSDNK